MSIFNTKSNRQLIYVKRIYLNLVDTCENLHAVTFARSLEIAVHAGLPTSAFTSGQGNGDILKKWRKTLGFCLHFLFLFFFASSSAKVPLWEKERPCKSKEKIKGLYRVYQ